MIRKYLINISYQSDTITLAADASASASTFPKRRLAKKLLREQKITIENTSTDQSRKRTRHRQQPDYRLLEPHPKYPTVTAMGPWAESEPRNCRIQVAVAKGEKIARKMMQHEKLKNQFRAALWNAGLLTLRRSSNSSDPQHGGFVTISPRGCLIEAYNDAGELIEQFRIYQGGPGSRTPVMPRPYRQPPNPKPAKTGRKKDSKPAKQP